MSVKRSKKNSIGDNLKKLTTHHGISFRRLSKNVGFTHSYLAKLAKNKYASPGIEVLKKISEFFKISLSQLTGEHEIDFKNPDKHKYFDKK